MDLRKRNWLCFICGCFALYFLYAGFNSLQKLILGHILGLHGPLLNDIPSLYFYIPTPSQHLLVLMTIAIIIMAFGALFCIPWSLKLFNKAKLCSIRAKELSSSDIPLKFPYVLYFRSFGTQLKTSLFLENASQTEEENIVHSLSPIGKTVAIGCSSNSIPPLGGCRINVSDDEWQNAVMQLSKDAQLTALRIGDTENLGWEIEYALKNTPDLQKLIFLIPDIEKTNLVFFAKLEDAIRECRPNDVQISHCYFNKQGWGTVSSIIYFEKSEKDSDNNLPFIMKQSRVPRRRILNYFGNPSSAFQKAMFPVYKQFGKLSVQKKFGNFLSTYYFYILTAIIICLIFGNRNINLEQIFPPAEQSITSENFTQAIQEFEQMHPKFANHVAQTTHEKQRGYMLGKGLIGCKYLSDEHLIEFAVLYLQVINNYHNRKDNNYGIDSVVSQLPEEDAIKFNNYMIKSALMALKLEDPEYTSINTPEEFQNQLTEAKSSLTEEQNEAVNVFLSSDKYSEEQEINYLEFISKLSDNSIKALLFREYFIINNPE